MTTDATLIMTTVADAAAAEKIANRLLEKHEAACVQEVVIRSRYRWEGELRSDPEILLLIKTSSRASAAAMQTIRSLHDYDVPEIVAVPVTDGLPDYLAWIAREASGDTAD